MKHLLDDWIEVSRRVRAADSLALFCDFDGTLAPIARKPELAEMLSGTRELLEGLSGQRCCTTAVVSARTLSDLRAKVRLKSVAYAGNHGLEIEGPGVRFIHPAADDLRPFFELVNDVLLRSLRSLKGVFIEDKGLSVSVHFRQAELEEQERAKSIVDWVLSSARSLGRVRIARGEKVIEVRPPVDWDKGRAIDFLIDLHAKRFANSGALPVFIGNDESGFEALGRRRGVSVHVGGQFDGSSACYYVRSPEEVREFLGLVGGCRRK